MEHIATVLLAVIFLQCGAMLQGLSIKVVRSYDDFPLNDCLSEDIDLLFVSDTAIGEQEVETYTGVRDDASGSDADFLDDENMVVTRKTSKPKNDDDMTAGPVYNTRDDIYREQMHLFSRFIDVFTSPAETNLTRVRVALFASVGARRSDPMFSQIVQKFNFHEFTDKATVKRVIEEDFTAPVATTSPLSAAQHVINIYKNEAVGVREHSQHVAVIAVGPFAKMDMDLIEDSYLESFNSTDVKMMFVLIDLSANPLSAVFPRNNVLMVRTSNSGMWQQTIPMALCSTCNIDWLPFRYARETEQREGSASCYRLLPAEGHINWMEALGNCEALGTFMASFESKEEMASLRQAIVRKMCSIIDTRDVSNSNSFEKYVDILIGLRRETSNFRKQFRWLSKPPLVYSHWATGEPSGGYGKACVVWRFFRGKHYSNIKLSSVKHENNETLSWTRRESRPENESGASESDEDQCFSPEDGWFTVPCGHRVTQMYLCEQRLSFFERSIQMSVTQRPSLGSIQSAITRGELGWIGNSDQTFSLASVAKLVDGEFEVFRNQHRMFFKNRNFHERIPVNDVVVYHCDDQQVVPYTYVCDRKPDCTNKRDELICMYPACSDSRSKVYRCKSGHCLPREVKCDLFPDCPDLSDEMDCLSCDQGMCPDGSCLPTHWFADGEVDCNANTFSSVDEEMASTRNGKIQDCVVTCNRSKCVSPDKMGDGVLDCRGPEGPLDETIGRLESMSCYSDKAARYNNWAPKCVYVKDRFGGVIGCKNMVHLQDCQNFTCPQGYIKCPDSYCIPIHYLHNEVADCPFQEDEDKKNFDCSGFFKCSDTKVCLHPDHVCDNHPDCPYGDDELGCHVTCRRGFICVGGAIFAVEYNKSEPLTDITFIDLRTRYLDLSGIDMSQAFPKLIIGRYENLFLVNLSNSRIQNIELSRTLNYDTASVAYLDMSMNLIKEITSTSWLQTTSNLRELNLSRNIFLESIDPEAFSENIQPFPLKTLDLSYTKVAILSYTLFIHLKKLSYLNLRGTRITELRSDMFPKGFTLQVLDLREIPLQDLQMETFTNVTILSSLYADSFKLCCPQIHNPSTKTGTCQAPKDAFSSCSDLMYEMVLRLLLWLNGILAVLGNFVVIVYRIFYDQTVLQMAYGHFVTHLGIADLIMGIYLLIIAFADVHYRGTYAWHETRWRNGVVCKLSGFASTLAAEASAIFIFLITVDRFLVVKFPLGQFRMSNRLMKLCCVLTWFLGIGLALIPLLPAFEHWHTYTSNGMCLGLPLMTTAQPGWQYSLAVFIVFDFVLFFLICLGQLIIYKTMTRVSTDTGIQTSHYSSRRTHDYTVARNLSLIAVTDFICWFPVCVTGLLALTGYDIGPDTYPWMAVLVLPINSALNPLIYTIPALKRRWVERKEVYSSKSTIFSVKNSR